MFEKVNPSHPDKVADRIAGAIVDLAYERNKRPTVAVEVLIGHGLCTVIVESSEIFTEDDIKPIIERIAGDVELKLISVPQDEHLFKNQQEGYRCGDNGIFKGLPITQEEIQLTKIAKEVYKKHPYDGKYILDGGRIIVCQSNAKRHDLFNEVSKHDYTELVINPLGDWTGGTTVDTGCTNRKLGSDMGFAVTGGGLHAKSICKADVSVNIYAHLKAQQTKKEVLLSCAIGDKYVDGIPYAEIVEIAKKYIDSIGGFEKFAEWGLVR